MDFSQFGLSSAPSSDPLKPLGWRPHFTAQLDPDAAGLLPARILAVHRNALVLTGPGAPNTVPPFAADRPATVGDWLLIDPNRGRAVRLLHPFSLFQRRAAGAEGRVQPIAANVDTLFIVSSCNADFNVARIERYLALAREAQVAAAVLLTKADQHDDPEGFAAMARADLPGQIVEPVNATDKATAERLSPWLGTGQTVAFAGSSGVGKSTLTNALLGEDILATQGIREDDAKGRHTTTHRELFELPSGGWVLDTPGMRELGLVGARDGIGAVFSDIEDLAQACRFRDCGHDTEPGCAVQAAIAGGVLDPDRLKRWRKLLAEDAHNDRTLAERRAKDKSFGKMVKRIMQDKR